MEKTADYWSIGKVANYLGVSVVTLRRWEKDGKLSSDSRTFGQHRRYDAYRIQRLFQNTNQKPLSAMPESLLMIKKTIWNDRPMH